MHFFPLAQMIRSGLWINIGHCCLTFFSCCLAVRCLVLKVATLNVYKEKKKVCFGKEGQEERRLKCGRECSKLGSSSWLHIRRMCEGQYDRSVLLSTLLREQCCARALWPTCCQFSLLGDSVVVATKNCEIVLPIHNGMTQIWCSAGIKM